MFNNWKKPVWDGSNGVTPAGMVTSHVAVEPTFAGAGTTNSETFVLTSLTSSLEDNADVANQQVVQ